MDFKAVLDQVIEEFKLDSPDIDGTGDSEGQIKYIDIMKDSYASTIKACVDLFDNKKANICELGSYFGIVAKSLKYFGHEVIACDIPYFYDKEVTKNYFDKSSIHNLSFNLRNYQIPIADSSQDLVIACEILEHFNFNPLPIIKELNRILRVGGYLYLATPNGNSIAKKLRFLFNDKQPSFTVSQLFKQLDSSQNMVVGLHWREYSISEIQEMILPFGFEVSYKKLTSDVGNLHGSFLKIIFKKIIFSLPGCKPNQIILFKKTKDSNMKLDVNVDS